MSELKFKLEEKAGVLQVVWSNGSTQPATPVEAELWRRNRELEKAGAELGKYLAPKVLEDAAICLKKLADLKPDKSAVTPSATDKSKYEKTASSTSSSSSSQEGWSEARKQYEKRKKERADAGKAAAQHDADAPRFGKRSATAGPKGFLPG